MGPGRTRRRATRISGPQAAQTSVALQPTRTHFCTRKQALQSLAQSSPSTPVAAAAPPQAQPQRLSLRPRLTRRLRSSAAYFPSATFCQRQTGLGTVTRLQLSRISGKTTGRLSGALLQIPTRQFLETLVPQ